MNLYITKTLRAAGLAVLFLPVLEACTDQPDGNQPEVTGKVALRLTTTIEGAATELNTSVNPVNNRAATFEANETKTAFNSGDRLTLTYINDSQSGLQKADAAYNGTDWSFTDGQVVYLDYPEPNVVSATYPSDTELQESGFNSVGLKTSNGNMTCIDVLQGNALPILTEGGARAQAAITLKHLHQQFNIRVDARTIDQDSKQATITNVKLTIRHTASGNSQTTDYSLTATADGTNRFHAIAPATDEAEGSYALTKASFTVLGGRTYQLNINGSREMIPNYSGELNIILRGDVLDFEYSNTPNGLEWSQEENDPTLPEGYDLAIRTPEELAAFANKVNNGGYYYINDRYVDAYQAKVLQTADIDLSTYTSNWPAIGNNTYAFKGTYNGNGFTINGLNTQPISSSTTQYVGLFGRVEDATLTGIHLRNTIINTQFPYAGSLVGKAKNTLISLCSAKGALTVNSTSDIYAGGLAGQLNENCHVTRCSSSVTLQGTTSNTLYLGGITGQSKGTTGNGNIITACVASDGITGSAGTLYSGGVAGEAEYTTLFSAISTSAITGTVTTGANSGGLAGKLSNGTLSGSYSTGEVTISGSSIKSGALIGNPANGYSANHCYGKGSIGTSGLTASSDDIVYGAGSEPAKKAVYNVVSKATDISNVKTTGYDNTLYPAYGIKAISNTWKTTGTWGSTEQDVIYPTLNMSYEGESAPY